MTPSCSRRSPKHRGRRAEGDRGHESGGGEAPAFASPAQRAVSVFGQRLAFRQRAVSGELSACREPIPLVSGTVSGRDREPKGHRMTIDLAYPTPPWKTRVLPLPLYSGPRAM